MHAHDGEGGQNGSTTLPAPNELLLDEPDLDLEIDPENIVEAAEQLLREGAPHDYDVLVIGSGPGGIAAAQAAAQGGRHTAIIEERELGGVCLNRGCIPTKTLLESIGVLRILKRAQNFGITFSGGLSPDIEAMHLRKDEVVARLRQQTHDMLEEAGVDIVEGHARFVEEHTVEVLGSNGVKRLTAVDIIIATGGKPGRLPILGAELPGVITSDEILQQRTVPRSLIVIGAGAVGVEFASIFAELGCQTTILEKASAVLPGEDNEIQDEMARSLDEMGISLVTGANLQRIEEGGEGLAVFFDINGEVKSLEASQILLATGREASISDLSLDKAGIETDNGKITIDDDNQTNVSGVYAIGDCIRRVGWAHQAAMEGREVAATILGQKSEIDARFVPSCYYTFPEVATVGLTQKAAEELGIEASVGRFSFRSNGRAATTGDNTGFVKLVVERESKRLLGCQIIGPRATELINEVSIALRNGATAEVFADALHAHPTFAEVLPGAARAAMTSLD